MRLVLSALLLVAFALPGNAALINRGNGMVYDSDQDITWLQNANLCRAGGDPSCVDAGILSNGTGTWEEAKAWADDLEFGGFDDWRLPGGPRFDPTCPFHDIAGSGISGGLGCTGNELSYLFTVYGLVATEVPLPVNTDVGPFSNLWGPMVGGGDFEYWTSIESEDMTHAAIVRFTTGLTGSRIKSRQNIVWAVRDGDVPAAVPEPGTLALLAGGLLGFIGFRRR